MNSNAVLDDESLLTELTYKGTCLTIFKKISRRCHRFSISTTTAAAPSEHTMSFRRRYTSDNSYLVYGFLILLTLLPSCISFPYPENGKRSSSASLLSGRNPASSTDVPHWVNPCNGTYSSAERSSASDESIGVFVNVVKVTCSQARFQFQKFREAYVKKTFKSEFKDHHLRFKDMVYQWLVRDMNMTKELGDVVSKEHLDSLSLEDAAVGMYGYLQRVAVGFEQMVYDHRTTNSDFKEEFIIAENNLRRILCEVRELIPEDRLRNFDNADRDIMKEHRHMAHLTDQHIRDWLIFRDYMSLVEYIEQVMSYFESKLKV